MPFFSGRLPKATEANSKDGPRRSPLAFPRFRVFFPSRCRVGLGVPFNLGPQRVATPKKEEPPTVLRSLTAPLGFFLRGWRGFWRPTASRRIPASGSSARSSRGSITPAPPTAARRGDATGCDGVRGKGAQPTQGANMAFKCGCNTWLWQSKLNDRRGVWFPCFHLRGFHFGIPSPFFGSDHGVQVWVRYEGRQTGRSRWPIDYSSIFL